MYKKWKKKISLFQKYILIFIYYCRKISLSKGSDKGRIIICFDGLFPHGGLVDRLKGIVSFYEVAKLRDYDFYIHFSHPFSLTHFLIPNKLNWVINRAELKFNPFTTKIFYLMNNFDVDPLKKVKSCNAKTIFVYSNIDYLGTIYDKNTQAENNKIWHDNYTDLFSVSNELNKEIQSFPIEKRIVFHTRFTSLMGDFKDTTDRVLEESAKQILIEKVVKKICEIEILKSNKKIYVLSDSILFLNYIKSHTHFNVLDGSPKHIDIKNDKDDLSTHLKTFSDFYFMALSDEIYLLNIDSMHNSGFSKYAAIVGSKTFAVLKG